jgi:hypothetical protein
LELRVDAGKQLAFQGMSHSILKVAHVFAGTKLVRATPITKAICWNLGFPR